MFVTILHDIHDPAAFQARAHRLLQGSTPHLRARLLLPATDLSSATALWEAPSEADLRRHLDPALGPAASQTYWSVAAEYAFGLPVEEVV